LFTTLIVTAHPGSTFLGASMVGLRMIVAAAILGVGVQRLTNRLAWPHPFRVPFAAIHVLAAGGYAAAWLALNSAIESLVRGQAVLVTGPGVGAFLILGVWIYVMVAGVSYATAATERAARAEAMAARAQLAALRAQLNPHFLFNALHAVVQLIPREPRRASQAAEQVAALLRTAIEEDRDLVPLSEEWRFVQRYLDLERIRFGDRLQVRAHLPDDTGSVLIPSFALQTLVENAVRHGAAPREQVTELAVTASTAGDVLTVTVQDNGVGATNEQLNGDQGTGLQRLRERLTALYADRARLELATDAGAGVRASIELPLERAE
jgi:LytS/YehU family sensor histidine kinase